MHTRKAVFLDRDGVLNRSIVRGGKPYPPGHLDELEIFPDAAEALARLRAGRFLLLVATNQPDVARGKQSRARVDALNAAIAEQLPIDGFLVCPHDDVDECLCRKPKPGLLLDGATQYGVELSRSYMVGDRWRDVEAGVAAGCRTILIDRGYTERESRLPPDFRAESLAAAADWILQFDRAR